MTNPNPQSTPPLWEVMHQVFMQTADTDLPLEKCIAAEIRAIEAELRKKFPKDPREMRACRWLLDEADRAERGEGD